MIKSKWILILGIAALSLGFAVFSITTMQKDEPNIPTQGGNRVQLEEEKELQKRAYVFTANEGGSVTKIDAITNKVIGSITVEGSAHNVQISPDGKVIGVTVTAGMGENSEHGSMNMNGTANFYEADTLKLIEKVEVGEHPAHIVFTTDGNYALVTNGGNNNVMVINARNYSIVNTIPTGKGPHGFRISVDSKYAYVANMGEDTVSVLDLMSFKELKKIKVGKAPVTTDITTNGKTLVATVNAENALAVIDISTNRVSKITVGSGPAQVFIEPDDKYAFVANQGTEQVPSNTLSKVDLKTRQVVSTILVGKGAHGVVTSNDSQFVYVTNMFEDTVSVVDNKEGTVIATIPVGKTPNGITYMEEEIEK